MYSGSDQAKVGGRHNTKAAELERDLAEEGSHDAGSNKKGAAREVAAHQGCKI